MAKKKKENKIVEKVETAVDAVNTNENAVAVEVVTTENKGRFGWLKGFVAAAVGAIISFGVTFGVLTADQAKTIGDKLNGVNTDAALVVDSLKKGDTKTALATAEKIVKDTKTVKDTVIDGVKKVKEKVDKIKTDTKETASEQKTELKK